MNRFPITLRTYGILTGIVVIINFIMYNVVLNNAGFNDPGINLITSIFGYLILIPILCLPFGLLIALIPYKGMGYRQKRLPAILLFYLCLNICLAVVSAIRQL